MEAPLGEGGMCLVHRVRLVDGRPAALKVLRPELAADPVQRARFEREAALADGLRHPNVVAVLGTLTWEGAPAVLLEYVDGGSLRQRLGRRLPRSEALRVLAAVARGLAEAHALGLVHRDLKPENVLLGGDGSVKVADWGLSRPVDDTSGLTASGSLLGTPAYMAPEQARGEQPTTAVDCWALGMVAWELLSGRLPGAGRSVVDLIRACAAGEAPDPAAILPPLSAGLTEFLRRLLAPDPGGRATAAEAVSVFDGEAVVAAAAEAESSSGVTRARALRRPAAPSPTAPPSPVVPSSAGHRRALPGALVLVLVAVMGLVLWRRAASPVPASHGVLDVVAASFDEPGRLRLTLRGERLGFRRVSVLDERLGTAVGDAVTVDLAAARDEGAGHFSLVLDLPVVPLRPVIVRVEGGGGPAVDLTASPLAALDRLMAPVEALRESELTSLLVRLTRIRAELNKVSGAARSGDSEASYLAAQAAARDEVASALDGAFGAEPLARLARVVPRLAAAVPGLDDAWAQRLLPLRYIDCALAEWQGVRSPWGSVDGAMGVTFQSFPSQRFKAPPADMPVEPGWQVAGTWTLLRSRSGKLVWPWLVSPAVVAGYRESIVMAAMFNPSAVVRRVLEARREPLIAEIELPTAEGIGSDLAGTMPVTLPPDRTVGAARLEVFLRLFIREHALDVEFGAPPRRVRVLNVALGGPALEGFSTVLPLRVSLPVDVRFLRNGSLPVRLSALDVPGQLHAQYPFFVHMVRLVVKP